MITLDKLIRLLPEHRRRKLVLCFSAIERSREHPSRDYVVRLLEIVLEDPKLSSDAATDLAAQLAALRQNVGTDSSAVSCEALIRASNHARHALLTIIGTLPAEWDLINPESLQQPLSDTSTERDEGVPQRAFFPGLFVYAEDIRSPFNVGSIFRTAEAFGAEKLILSPFCASPEHTRAQRSSMGCIDILPWEQTTLDSWLARYRDDHPDEAPLPVFALETGGTDIASFNFPRRGVVVLGSEELGVNPDTLKKAEAGRVTIPLTGSKASLNVAVAFGILMQNWTLSLGK